MNLAELRQEVSDRGFDYLPAARINRFLNKRYRRVCNLEAWPFLEASTTLTAPASIPDLRAILHVTDTSGNRPLGYEDYRTILDRDPNLRANGNPTSWYLFDGQLHVYPLSGNTLSVRYLRRAAPLTTDGDEPLIPEEYQYEILVEGACADAYRDSDNAEMAALCEAEYASAIDDMRNDLLVPNYDGPSDIAITFGASTDW